MAGASTALPGLIEDLAFGLAAVLSVAARVVFGVLRSAAAGRHWAPVHRIFPRQLTLEPWTKNTPFTAATWCALPSTP